VSEPRQQLNVPVYRVDRRGMIDLELELVRENPSWVTVLQAYQAAQEELAAQQAQAAGQSAQPVKSASADDAVPEGSPDLDGEASQVAEEDSEHASAAELDDSETSPAPKKRATRWVQRITKLPGIASEELSKIHGRLIAYDLLKCDLVGRSDGMVYQLTSTGKEILGRCGDDELTAAA
jgi:hypothetical protein